VFREVRRVLADDGTLWLNLGDSYASDTKGSGGASIKQSSNAGSRYGMSQRLNHGLKQKDLVGIPWRVAFALQADGWYLRSDIIWAKPNPMPESVTDRPTKAHEYVFLLSKSARYYYDAGAISEPSLRAGDFPGGDYAGREVEPLVNHGWLNKTGVPERRNARTVWTIPTQPTPDAHFATFPETLAERCILAGSAMGDTVLDPFFGSGTVGKVAERLGRKWIGIELNEAYTNIAKKKTAQMGLLMEE